MQEAAMKMLGVIAGGLMLAAFASPALARPPTVMNSPGYDARLAESRQALWASQYYYWQQAQKPVKRPANRRVTPAPQR
jgi:hypothetical protein